MPNPVVHWELWTTTPDKTSAFYRKAFDWKIQPSPQPDYHMVETGGHGGINGGIMTPKRPGTWPGNMSFYIAVEDLAAARKRVVQAGGKILVEAEEVPNMGTYSLFSDPDGRVVGLWKFAAR
ncbi:MAG TPA: VOC family protein [Tepidisphaeraceae bacterium]|jgi:hypothetical protein|nr:VOC family protein [Tepidisphaeraceae bacterium]